MRYEAVPGTRPNTSLVIPWRGLEIKLHCEWLTSVVGNVAREREVMIEDTTSVGSGGGWEDDMYKDR